MAKKPSEQVKVGIIGAGIGQSHIRGYKQVPNAQIVALCDMNTDRARQVAKDLGVEHVEIYADYREMLDKAGVDAVSVGVPNFLHMPITVDCLNAGKHVLCEKPLAMTAKEGQKMADAAAKNKLKCMVGQVNRFRADSQYFKQLVQSGELGRIYYGHAVCLRKKGIPGYGGWFTTKAQSGGGPLIDIGVHLLDIAWWLAGAPNPVTVSGVTYAEFGPRKQGLGSWGQRNMNGTFDVEDLAVGLIRFDNGLTLNLEVSWALHNQNTQMAAHLYGTEGGFDWGDKPGLFRDINGVAANSTLELGQADAWAGQTGHFVDCILNNKTPDPDVTQGVTMMKMLEGLYKSAAAGKEVAIK
jgi:predicted dehydrogenase